jgi:hypothetical protein
MESNQPAMKTFNDLARLALIQDLERLRELVLKRLSSIEMLAREHLASALPAREMVELEDSFKKKSAELEETRRLLQVQADQAREDWLAAMSKLEDDRRLLAEAWERVETERIDSLNARQASQSLNSPIDNPRTAGSTGLPTKSASIPIRSAGPLADSCNPVTEEILRQFQTLCSDVRQSAVGRRASR